jgi:hypothetical protein
MLMCEARIVRPPFATSTIYSSPFRSEPAWKRLRPHWLWSPLGQRHFIDLLRRRLPSAFWPPPVFAAVVDAVADVLVADLRARRRNGGAS